MEIQLQIRKLEAKNTLLQYHKDGLIQSCFFKKSSFINANQSE